jgi:hypothetical protein
MRNPACRSFLMLLIAGCALCGCKESTSQPAPVAGKSGPVSLDFSKAPQSKSGDPVTPDKVVSTDPTAARLQDIGGYIMLYYREHNQMPQALSDLSSLPGGQDLNFNSSSGQPFVYQPAGMWSPERNNKCIVVYDPQLKDSKRWVLFMSIPKAGGALDVDVYLLPEPFFLNYRP